MKKFTILLWLVLTGLLGFCQVPIPLSCDFDASDDLPAGWNAIIEDQSGMNFCGVTDFCIYPYSSPNVWAFTSDFPVSDFGQYLVSPRLANATEDSIRFSFKYYTETSEDIGFEHAETFRVGYVMADSYVSPADFLWQSPTITAEEGGWQSFEINLPPNAQYIVLHYNVTSCQSYMFVDNILIRPDSPFSLVNVTVSASAGGTVTPGSSTVEIGESIDFQVVADEGYRIVSVLLDGQVVPGSVNVDAFSFTLPSIVAPHEITVTFAIKEYSIVVIANEGGAIVPNGGGIGQVIVPWGCDTTFRFVPDMGYHVEDVLIDNFLHLGELAEYRFQNVRANHTLRVTFAENQLTIAASAGEGGSITPSGSVQAIFGESRTFTITPQRGYFIDTVWVDGTVIPDVPADGYTYTFENIVDDHTILAVFARYSYLVSATYTEGGTLTIEGGSPAGQDSVSVLFGDSLSFRFIPNFDYNLADILLDGTSIETANPLIMRDIDAPHQLHVVFEMKRYDIAVNVNGNGSVLPASALNVPFADTTTFSIAPADCQQLDSIRVEGVVIANAEEIAFTRIEGRHTLEVFFSPVYYGITTLSADNGTITAPQQAECGRNILISLDADPCFRLAHFYLDGVERDDLVTGFPPVVILSNIREAHTLSADFEPITYTVAVANGSGGTVNQLASQTVNCGSDLNFEIIPNDCHYVASLTLNGLPVENAVYAPANEDGKGDTVRFSLENIVANAQISVTYGQFRDTVFTAATGNGTITPTAHLLCGDSQQFVITPADCHQITDIQYDGVSVLEDVVWENGSARWDVNDIHANHTLDATFEIITYSIQNEQLTDGQLLVSTGNAAQCGEEVRFTFVPDFCYQVASVRLNGVDITASLTRIQNQNPNIGDSAFYSMQIFENQIVEVDFEPITYRADWFVYGQGTLVSTAADNIVNCSESVTFTATPEPCHYVDAMFLNGWDCTEYQTDANGVATLTLPAVYADQVVGVQFVRYDYQVIAETVDNGEISVPEEAVSCGDSAQVRFTPAPCHHLDSIRINSEWLPASVLTLVDESYVYTIPEVLGNTIVSASFSVDSMRFTSLAGEPLSTTSASVACGSDLTVYLLKDGCQRISHLVYNGVSFPEATFPEAINYSGDTIFVTLRNVTTDCELEVYLETIPYSVHYSVAGYGSVVPSFESDRLLCGDSIAFRILPADCQQLQQVVMNGNILPMDNDSLLVISRLEENLNLVFFFEGRHFQIATETNGPGTIAGPSGDLDCGSDNKFFFVPASCARLDSVWVDGVCVNNEFDITEEPYPWYAFEDLHASHELRAAFALRNYQVEVVTNDYSLIDVPQTNDVVCGEDFGMNLMTDDCHFVQRLLVDGADATSLLRNSHLQLTDIQANRQVEVLFGERTYQFAINYAEPSATLYSDQSTLVCGSDTTITVQYDDSCYLVKAVIINGVAVPIQETYEFDSVRSDIAITVKMQKKEYPITVLADEHSDVHPSGEVWVQCGDGLRIEYGAQEGYYVERVVVDGTDTIEASGIYEFQDVTEAHTFEVSTGRYMFTINATSAGNGHIVLGNSQLAFAGDTVMPFGSVLALDFVADNCHEISNVVVDGESIGAVSSYTFADIADDHQVEVEFVVSQQVVNVTSNAGGAVTNLGTNELTCGEAFSISITPADCYRISNVLMDGAIVTGQLQPVGNEMVLNLESVEDNHNIDVRFAQIRYEISTASNFGGTFSATHAMPLCGSDYTLRVTPYDCYEIDTVWVNGAVVPMEALVFENGVLVYTISDIREAYLVAVHFRGVSYQFDVVNNGDGEVLFSQNSVDCAGEATFSIVPSACERIESVYLNALEITDLLTNHPNSNPLLPDTASYTVSQFSEDVLVTINYREVGAKQIAIAKIDGLGVVTRDTLTVACGGEAQINLDMECHYVESLTIDGIAQQPTSTISFTDVLENHEVVANFAAYQYEIEAISGMHGTIAPAGISSVVCDSTITYEIIPDEGYYVSRLLIDNQSVTPANEYTFTHIRENHTIEAEFAIYEYDIVATANEGGEVSPANARVQYGESASIAIRAEVCYHLDSLFVDGIAVEPTNTVDFANITENHDVRAVFAMDEFAVTAIAAENGSIIPAGTSMERCGSSIDYTITPDACYRLAALLVDGSDRMGEMVGNTFIFSDLREDHTIEPVFAIIEYQVATSCSEGGSVTASSSVDCGDNFTVSIAPEPCYHIDSLIVDGRSFAATTSYTFASVDDNHTLRVVFALNEYTITAIPAAHGTIEPAGNSVVSCGESMTYTMTPDEGCELVQLFVDGVDLFAMVENNTFTFADVTASHTIRPVFNFNSYRIVATAGQGGAISPASADVQFGSSATFSITPDDCYHLAALYVDGAAVEPVAEYTFENVTANHTLHATFAIDEYTVTAVAAPHGTILPAGISAVNCGGSITYAITPDRNYYLSGLLVDGENVDLTTDYTFNNVRGNHTIEPQFTIFDYLITTSCNDGGTLSPAIANVQGGDTLTVAITPDDCHYLDSLFVDEVLVENADSITFSDITADHSVRAVFAMREFAVSVRILHNGEPVEMQDALLPCAADSVVEIPSFGCMRLDSVVVNGTQADAVGSYLITDIHTDYQIDMYFSDEMFFIAATVQGNGIIEPADTVWVLCSGSQTFEFAPATGWLTQELILDGISLGTPQSNTYTFSDVAENHTIEVVFAIQQFSITASVDPADAGTITPAGTQTYDYGENATYIIAPFANYRIVDVQVDGVSVGNADTYTFANIDADHTIVAYLENVGIANAERALISVYAVGHTVYVRNESHTAIRAIEVYDAAGRRIAQRAGTTASAQFTLEVAQGIYIVRLHTDAGAQSYKVRIGD